MNLMQYYSKPVNVLAANGIAFNGVVGEYFYPEDNVNGKESIIVDVSSGGSVEFYEEDIKQIEIAR